MKVNIFSDIRCPFCYVGKKKFEKALESFAHAGDIEVEWHSFQLDPSLQSDPHADSFEYFSKAKGVSLEQAKQMHGHAQNAGKEVGIDFEFATQKIANSLKGHLLIQLAKQKNLASEMEEALFRAQFIEGKNIDSESDLIEIGSSIGLSEMEVKEALNSDELRYKVKEDEMLARKIGVRAVPFFILNDKYGISGAQQPSMFLEALEKSYKEFSEGDKGLEILGNSPSCEVDGDCK
ncbi:DsbA family oxidoreductase [Chryseobacterium sp. A321]